MAEQVATAAQKFEGNLMRLIMTCAAALLFAGACATPTANTGTVSDASGQAVPAQAPSHEQKPAPTWGQRYTWPDGLAVEITAPKPCKPGKYSSPQDVQRAVKFTVTVINGTKEPFEVAAMAFGWDVQFAGREAETVFDSGGACGGGGLESANVMPGKTFTYDVAYSVGKDPGEMQMTIQPSFTSDKAVFVGQA